MLMQLWLFATYAFFAVDGWRVSKGGALLCGAAAGIIGLNMIGALR